VHRETPSPAEHATAVQVAVAGPVRTLLSSRWRKCREPEVHEDHPLPGRRMRSMLPGGDKQFLNTPWYGSRQMARHMQRQGHKCGRHRVRRLMQLMRLVPVCQTPNTSRKHPQHKIYPYLLRSMEIDRPNQVWCTDITCIPLSADCCAIACRAMDGARLPVSCGDPLPASGLPANHERDGLGHAQGSGMAAVKHDGGGFLH
jgi:hypothetical protein